MDERDFKALNKDSDELVKLTNYYLEDGDDYNGMPINNRFKEVWVRKSELEKIKL